MPGHEIIVVGSRYDPPGTSKGRENVMEVYGWGVLGFNLAAEPGNDIREVLDPGLERKGIALLSARQKLK